MNQEPQENLPPVKTDAIDRQQNQTEDCNSCTNIYSVKSEHWRPRIFESCKFLTIGATGKFPKLTDATSYPVRNLKNHADVVKLSNPPPKTTTTVFFCQVLGKSKSELSKQAWFCPLCWSTQSLGWGVQNVNLHPRKKMHMFWACGQYMETDNGKKIKSRLAPSSASTTERDQKRFVITASQIDPFADESNRKIELK